ncbi:hypothetical protein ACIQBJ_04390 [Kitasatospora sp. NPDC088391]
MPDAAREATRLLGGYFPDRDGKLGDGTRVVGLRTVDPGRLADRPA